MGSDSVVDPAARDKYLLQVTAGPNYDPATQQDVPVNGQDHVLVESDLVTAYIKVRIKDYHGLPRGSPSTSPYFEHKLHTSDRYSVAFSFVPKQPLHGKDMVLGFDYDHSIKHQLPPGFKYAMKIATTMLDPGIYSDPYCDEPYLYGPALSGLFSLNIGDLTSEVSAEEQIASLEKETGGVVEEGSSCASGAKIRHDLNLPTKFKKRRKHFLNADNLAAFSFEKGRMYHADFFNPHLDFANFSLRLPGFSISVARYIDDKTHHLRYVFKDRNSGKLAFVVFFRLLFGEELKKVAGAQKGEAETRESQPVENKESVSVGHGQSELQNGETIQEHQTAQKIGEQPPQAEVQPSASVVTKEDQEANGYSPTAAVTALTTSLYGALSAMGRWSSTSSSSSTSTDGNSPKRRTSPQPAGMSLDSRVDKMDNVTVEKYLQSRQGHVQA
ncbi:hypothetical protein ACEQ8H_003486 [Pleosporales sp. CAS-2024a]